MRDEWRRMGAIERGLTVLLVMFNVFVWAVLFPFFLVVTYYHFASGGTL